MDPSTIQDWFFKENGERALARDTINDALVWGARDYFRNNGFRWVEVPTISRITGACENVDTLYALTHGKSEAYLAQTGQLYLETKIPGHKKVWTIMQSSRNEQRADARHLNQFTLVEFEELGGFAGLLERIEAVVKAMMAAAIKEEAAFSTLEKSTEEVEGWLAKPFGRITYRDALRLLDGTRLEARFGHDLGAAEEQYVVEKLGQKPTFITNYPTAIKFFNMRQHPEYPAVVNSADLILPYAGEAVGSAERENDHARLVRRLKESPMFKTLEKRGKTIDDFLPYLEFVKAHPALHSGCGIGLARVTQAVLGEKDIRTGVPYPLTAETLY